MPRYYCDYCDAYLTHDSASVRKQHNIGFKHKANVRAYYALLKRTADEEAAAELDATEEMDVDVNERGGRAASSTTTTAAGGMNVQGVQGQRGQMTMMGQQGRGYCPPAQFHISGHEGGGPQGPPLGRPGAYYPPQQQQQQQQQMPYRPPMQMPPRPMQPPPPGFAPPPLSQRPPRPGFGS